jgi:hypothetical protein
MKKYNTHMEATMEGLLTLKHAQGVLETKLEAVVTIPTSASKSYYSIPPYQRWGSVAELTCHSQGSTPIG